MQLIGRFLMVLAPLLLFQSSSSADEAPVADGPERGAARTEDRWRHPFSLRSGLEITAAKTRRTELTKIDHLTSISFHFSPWMETFIAFRVGYMTFGYSGEVGDDTTIRADLAKKGQFSVNNGLRLRLLERKRIRWTAFAEYDTALNGESPTLTYAGASLGGSEIDLTDYVKDHAAFSYGWHRYAAGTGLLVRLGRVSPTFSVGIEHFDAHVSLRLDEESRRVLTAFGHDPSKVEKDYPFTRTTAIFLPGAEISLASRTTLHVECMVVPLSHGWVLGAGAGIVYRP